MIEARGLTKLGTFPLAATILAIIDTAIKLTMSTMKLILSFSVFSTTSTVVWYIFREGGAMFPPAAAKSSLDRPLMAMQCSTFD